MTRHHRPPGGSNGEDAGATGHRHDECVRTHPDPAADRYDAIVVGAGHNGLVCAAYLAQAGHRVLVVERGEQVGGACVTDELFPGYCFSTASLVTTLFRREIIDELSLAKHGLEILPRDPSVTALFPDGRTLTLSADPAASTADIARFSPEDARNYVRYGESLRRLAAVAERYFTGPARTPLLADIPALKAALREAVDLPDADLAALAATLFGSARDVLDGWFESEELKVTLSTDGTVGIDAGPSLPGTAYLMLYHQMGSTEAGRPSWGQVKGGMGAITRALAEVCAEYGADVRTGVAVEEITVGAHGADGVRLADGSRIGARVVVSAADPLTTFTRLVDSRAVPTAYRTAIAGRTHPGVAAKIHLALDRLPGVRGLPADGPHYRGTLQILPSMDHLDWVHAQARAGLVPREPHVECTIPSVLDPGLAPPGKHVLSMYIQYVPYALAGTTWDRERESFADHVLDYVEPYLPGLRAAVVDRCVLTPPDLERRLGLPGGNLYHGAMSPLDLFAGRPVHGYPDYRTPVPDLYLCAAGTRPGGGVFGVPGRNAGAVVRARLEGGAR